MAVAAITVGRKSEIISIRAAKVKPFIILSSLYINNWVRVKSAK